MPSATQEYLAPALSLALHRPGSESHPVLAAANAESPHQSEMRLQVASAVFPRRFVWLHRRFSDALIFQKPIASLSEFALRRPGERKRTGRPGAVAPASWSIGWERTDAVPPAPISAYQYAAHWLSCESWGRNGPTLFRPHVLRAPERLFTRPSAIYLSAGYRDPALRCR